MARIMMWTLRKWRSSWPGERRSRPQDRKSTRLNSSHTVISYAVFCLIKKKSIMSANVRPIPEGYHSITRQLTCCDSARALDFYKEAVGTNEIMHMAGPDGQVMHTYSQ